MLDLTNDVKVTGVQVLRNDGICFTLRVERMIGTSTSVQLITLRSGDNKVRFETDVEWQERHRLLKVHFESNIRSRNAICGMQMCHVERPTHRSNTYEKDRYEVINRHYSALFEADRGVALFNKAIWGVSCKENDLALTLLHAPTVPDDTCDRGHQHFEFAIGAYDEAFTTGKVVTDGFIYNNSPLFLAGAAKECAGIWADKAIVETIKPEEEGTGTVVRLWEHRGTRTKAVLHLPAAAHVYECGMQEKERIDMGEGSEIRFVLKPFEIKTFLVTQ